MRKGNCIYFNGGINDTCDKGHDYLEVAIPLTEEQIRRHNKNFPNHSMTRTAIAKRVPCHARNGVKTCPDYLEPTDEQIRQQKAEFEQLLNRTLIVRKKIVEHIKESGKWQTTCSGHIQCPICENGIVEFSYAGAYNGHIHASCSNGCVNWME